MVSSNLILFWLIKKIN